MKFISHIYVSWGKVKFQNKMGSFEGEKKFEIFICCGRDFGNIFIIHSPPNQTEGTISQACVILSTGESNFLQCPPPPDTVNKRAVRILLECILV